MKKYLLIFSILYNSCIFAEPFKVLVIGENRQLVQFLKNHNYIVEQLDLNEYPNQKMLNEQKWEGIPIAEWIPEYQKISFRLYRFLKDKDYNIIFFPERNGYGYYLTEAKKQGYAFEKTILINYVTEPAEWLWDISNIIVPDISSYLQADSEKKSVEQADIAIVPSNFAYNILRDKGWNFPHTTKVLFPLYENKSTTVSKISKNVVSASKIKEIVFIEPNDFRHGYDLFLQTVKKAYELNPESMQKIKITVLHKDSLNYQTEDIVQFDSNILKINHLTNVDYIEYIKDPTRLIVFTSREDLGSYDKYVAVYAGVRFIAMKDGFLEEIIANTEFLSPHLNTSSLARKLINELVHPSSLPQPKKSLQEVFHEWEEIINEINMKATSNSSTNLPQYTENPLVSVCITHFNRPEQLKEALDRFSNQTYKNFEVLVMDDGSKPEVIEYLRKEIEPFMQKYGWKIFYQDNRFISNARNNLVKHAKGSLLLLFEDDDLPLPDTIERFVRIKQKTQADIVNTNLALASKNKFYPDELWLTPGSHITTIIGENHVGYSAIALVSKEVFQKLGGYLDSYGFLYSDYEFYLRAGLNNIKIVTSLEPLYIYNFVGQNHHVYEAHRSQFYQTRVVLSAYKYLLPKEFRNIPFWMYSIEQEKERLIKENNELNDQINKLTYKTSILRIIYLRLQKLFN